MRRRLLVDTNVLIDIAQPNRPQHLEALSLLDEYEVGNIELCVCAGSLKDVYYILAKCGSEADARAYVAQFLEIASVLPVDYPTCRMAAHSNEPDFEDGIIRACAEATGVDCIISRDAAAFANCSIQRLSPKDYIDRFVEAEEIELP